MVQKIGNAAGRFRIEIIVQISAPIFNELMIDYSRA
jgi:hypothetical protein